MLAKGKMMDKIVRKEYYNAGLGPVWDAVNDISDKLDELVEGYDKMEKLMKKCKLIKKNMPNHNSSGKNII